jgi:acetolactate synthase-1/2/3 large subunit
LENNPMTLPFSNARTGGKILVDQLLIHGADMAFCVPGESYLEVLDALFDVRDRFKLVNARHEAGAANMAEAYGKVTGKPGICMVTRGPGACHASVGVHTAFQDSTPMILLIGQVGRDMMDREAFQEIDYRQMFGPVAKWAAQIDVTARIPEYIARAFHIATSGRPGPVVLALPEDMLTEVTQAGDAVCYRPTQPAAPPQAFAPIRELLDGAKKPMILAGGPGWSDRACAQLRDFAEANGIPVATSFRRQDTFDNRSSCFAGDLGTSGPPALVQRFKEADLLFVIGARLGEMTTQGYTILSAPTARPRLVHVHADADELGKVFTPDIAVLSSADNFMASLAECRWFAADRWSPWRKSARTDYLNAVAAPGCTQALDVAAAMIELGKRIGDNAIVTLDAGNHTGWPQREALLGGIRRRLAATKPRDAFYPGAAARFAAFLADHPTAEAIGAPGGGQLPWLLIPGLDPSATDESCFRVEAFCSVVGETSIDAPDAAAFLDRATAFANEVLWGSLNATVIVDPRSARGPAVAAALDRAIAGLRYGTISLNHWSAIGYGLGVTPWGAYPGHTRGDIQSGTGFVHNPLMFSRSEKAVVRAPFRAWPKPVWFGSHRTALQLAARLVPFEADRSLRRLPAILALALRG